VSTAELLAMYEHFEHMKRDDREEWSEEGEPLMRLLLTLMQKARHDEPESSRSAPRRTDERSRVVASTWRRGLSAWRMPAGRRVPAVLRYQGGLCQRRAKEREQRWAEVHAGGGGGLRGRRGGRALPSVRWEPPGDNARSAGREPLRMSLHRRLEKLEDAPRRVGPSRRRRRRRSTRSGCAGG
jgi:hypothetical protein